MSNLKQLRDKENVTRKQLADKIGVTEVYICYLEIGKRKNPSARIVIEIAKALRVKVQEIIFQT